jgi:serine/threonine-protein kinase
MVSGKYVEACSKFQAAADLSATPGVRLNLGDCYEKLGRMASAASKYEEALALAGRAGDAPAADLARSRLAAIKPRFSYIHLTVAPDAVVDGLEIERDGAKVPQTAWGTALLVDPGDHEIRATAPGRTPWSKTVSVTTAGQQDVTIPVLPAAAPAAHGAPSEQVSPGQGWQSTKLSTPEHADLPSGAGGMQRTFAVVSAALGVVGFGVGGYFGSVMLSRKSDYQQHQDPTGKCKDLECQTASHDAAAAGNVATVGFIAGGVLVAAGAALWLTAPRTSHAAPSVALVPLVGPAGAGVGTTGSW